MESGLAAFERSDHQMLPSFIRSAAAARHLISVFRAEPNAPETYLLTPSEGYSPRSSWRECRHGRSGGRHRGSGGRASCSDQFKSVRRDHPQAVGVNVSSQRLGHRSRHGRSWSLTVPIAFPKRAALGQFWLSRFSVCTGQFQESAFGNRFWENGPRRRPSARSARRDSRHRFVQSDIPPLQHRFALSNFLIRARRRSSRASNTAKIPMARRAGIDSLISRPNSSRAASAVSASLHRIAFWTSAATVSLRTETPLISAWSVSSGSRRWSRSPAAHHAEARSARDCGSLPPPGAGSSAPG